jgi:hypothetical protein
MKNRSLKSRLVWLVCIGSAVLSATVMAQPPENGANKKPRSRPQVIYHLPPSSSYGATLHSQAKGQNNEVPVESGTPSAAQIQRDNPNAATSPQQQKVTRPVQSNRPASRQRSSNKAPGHGNKPHKK